MPREKQKRGRREEKKRKRDEDPAAAPLKRRKSLDDQDEVNIIVNGDAGEDFIGLSNVPDSQQDPPEAVFFGMLDQEEQDYYAQANNKLEVNDFGDDEERASFLEAVHQESNGKELKIACSQSSSRFLERLIRMSSPSQLKRLFSKFSGNFLSLVQHRFASHCCETLFTCAAPVVSEEFDKEAPQHSDQSADEEEHISMESLFLQVVAELEGNLGYLLTERFASHTIRVLLVVLSGDPLEAGSVTTILASRKKENINAVISKGGLDRVATQKRQVPDSFKSALSGMIKSAVSSLDTTYIRALATHPTGNPVLQLLLRLELTQSGKSKAKDHDSVLHKLLPDDPLEEGTDSAKFLNGILYDATGSRLLETIIEYAPGKMFKNMFRNLFKERIGSLARNEIAGYVAIRLLERLGKDDLNDAVNKILPEIPSLVARSRVSVLKVVLERCVVRGIDTKILAEQFKLAYGDDETEILSRMLHNTGDEEEPTGPPVPQSKTKSIHGSLLAQSMLQAPGPMSELIYSGLVTIPAESLTSMAEDTTASHVIQDALTAPTSSLQFRRKLIPKFFGHVAALALNSSGSRVIDALWSATDDLHFMKERIAEELQHNEAILRESLFGRAVWRNWSMDLYQRRKRDWSSRAKSHKDVHVASTSEGGIADKADRPKLGIEQARQRFATKQSRAQRPKDGSAMVSANA